MKGICIVTKCVLAMLLFVCIGCKQEQEVDLVIGEPNALGNFMANTSWKLTSVYEVKNGKKNYITEYIGNVITFSLEHWGNYNGVNLSSWYTLYLNGKKSAAWYGSDGSLIVEWTAGNDAMTAGKYSVAFGPFSNIIEITNQNLVLYSKTSDRTYEYTKVIGYDMPGGDDNPGSDDSSYEKPDVGFYDFDATTNSITVKYKIFNRTEAQVTSAKINYGTTSSCSSSVTCEISGVYIIGRIKNLKKGTTYYVKCKATGKGGTTTTETTKIGTLY